MSVSPVDWKAVKSYCCLRDTESAVLRGVWNGRKTLAIAADLVAMGSTFLRPWSRNQSDDLRLIRRTNEQFYILRKEGQKWLAEKLQKHLELPN